VRISMYQGYELWVLGGKMLDGSHDALSGVLNNFRVWRLISTVDLGIPHIRKRHHQPSYDEVLQG
jgi:hypothetical protein